jgi:hypothetical protein
MPIKSTQINTMFAQLVKTMRVEIVMVPEFDILKTIPIFIKTYYSSVRFMEMYWMLPFVIW